MREIFFKQLYALIRENNKVVFITADLGYGLADKIKEDFPERFFNLGAAEQTCVGAAVGFSLSGKIPFVYSITPFLIYRPMEWIRNYLDHEKIPVILVGSGKDNDYLHDGFTHYGDDSIMDYFKNIQRINFPQTSLSEVIELNLPAYINLKR